MANHLSDSESIASIEDNLLRQYRNTGNQEFLGPLYNEYMHLVYGLCLKYLKEQAASEDAVMDIYETIASKLLTTEVQHFKSWLYMVSKNHCLMILRKNNPEVNIEISMESPDVLHLKDEKVKLENDLKALEECIEELKEEQRVCVKQFFIDKKSYQQITTETTIEIKKVKSHIQNGKRNLKICLDGKHVKR